MSARKIQSRKQMGNLDSNGTTPPGVEFCFERPITAAALLPLFEQTDWAADRSQADVEAMLEATPVRLGVWQEDRLVGFARAITDGRFRALIDDVVVDASLRGQSIGSELMRRLAQRLAEVEQIFLRCEESLVPFYEQLGYRRSPLCMDLLDHPGEGRLETGDRRLEEGGSSTKDELLGRDRAHLIHSLHDPDVVREGHVWVEAEGAILIDSGGKKYLDVLSGLWNVIAGHGREELVLAAARQMKRLPYCSGYAGSTNLPAIELAERLAELTYPSINRFFFTSGGGEASETSFKMARFYWKLKGKPEKTKIISRQWGYHGVTLAAMSATGIESYWPMFEPRVPGFIHIPSPYPYRYQAPPGIDPGIAAAEELEQAILREGPETVALFIAEPVQGAGGVIVPPANYFSRIREICDQYDVLLVADEVITAFGRTGKMFGLEHWGVEPDMIQFAKGITSGYFPLGGIGISNEIGAVLDSGEAVWMHAYTYSAHPVGCAVALRNLDLVKSENFPSQAAEKGSYLLEKLKDALGDHPHVGEVRGLGLMAGVELVEDKTTKAEFDPIEKIGIQVHRAAQERGFFTRLRGDVFCLAPPVVTTEAQLDQIVKILHDSIVAVLG